MIGGLVAIIGRYFLQMKSVEVNENRHNAVIDGVEGLDKKTDEIAKFQKKDSERRQEQIKHINKPIFNISDYGRINPKRDSISVDNLGERIILKNVTSINEYVQVTVFKDVPIEKKEFFNMQITHENGKLPKNYSLRVDYESLIGNNESFEVKVQNNCGYVEIII